MIMIKVATVILILIILIVIFILFSKKEKHGGEKKIKETMKGLLDPNNPATILLQEGMEAFNAKNYFKAVDSLKRYLNINPFDEEVQKIFKEAEEKGQNKEQKKEFKEKKDQFEYVLKNTRIVTSLKKKTLLSKEESKEIFISHIETFINQGFVTKNEAEEFLNVNLDLINKDYCQFFTDINGTVILTTESSEFILINPTKEEYFEEKWDIFNFDKWGLRKR